MFASIAIGLLALLLMGMGLSTVQEATNDLDKRSGGLWVLVGIVLFLLAVGVFPYFNVWESKLRAQAINAYNTELGKCVSSAK